MAVKIQRLPAKGKRVPNKYPTMEHKRSSIRVVVLLGILPFLNGCAAIALHCSGSVPEWPPVHPLAIH